jgi:hypothetical protein
VSLGVKERKFFNLLIPFIHRVDVISLQKITAFRIMYQTDGLTNTLISTSRDEALILILFRKVSTENDHFGLIHCDTIKS